MFDRFEFYERSKQIDHFTSRCIHNVIVKQFILAVGMCYNFYLPVAINMSLFLLCISFVLARPISLISYSFRECSFLIPVTWVEGIFEELRKFLSPGRIWQKVLVHQHDLLESFGTPTTRSIQLKTFSYPFYNFAIVFVPLTLNKKIPKRLTVFLNNV